MRDAYGYRKYGGPSRLGDAALALVGLAFLIACFVEFRRAADRSFELQKMVLNAPPVGIGAGYTVDVRNMIYPVQQIGGWGEGEGRSRESSSCGWQRERYDENLPCRLCGRRGGSIGY